MPIVSMSCSRSGSRRRARKTRRTLTFPTSDPNICTRASADSKPIGGKDCVFRLPRALCIASFCLRFRAVTYQSDAKRDRRSACEGWSTNLGLPLNPSSPSPIALCAIQLPHFVSQLCRTESNTRLLAGQNAKVSCFSSEGGTPLQHAGGPCWSKPRR